MKPIKLSTYRLLTYNLLIIGDTSKGKKPVTPPEPSEYFKLDVGKLDINKLK